MYNIKILENLNAKELQQIDEALSLVVSKILGKEQLKKLEIGEVFSIDGIAPRLMKVKDLTIQNEQYTEIISVDPLKPTSGFDSFNEFVNAPWEADHYFDEISTNTYVNSNVDKECKRIEGLKEFKKLSSLSYSVDITPLGGKEKTTQRKIAVPSMNWIEDNREFVESIFIPKIEELGVRRNGGMWLSNTRSIKSTKNAGVALRFFDATFSAGDKTSRGIHPLMFISEDTLITKENV